MIDKVKEFYVIDINEKIEHDEGIIFFLDGEKFYFVKHDFDNSYLLELIDLVLQLKRKNIYLHDFIFNKYGNIDSDGYCLMKLNCFDDVVTEYELKKFYSNYELSEEVYKNFVAIDKLWYKKIDYIEYQLSELSDNSVVNYSCDYYIGISEMLLQFLSNFLIEKPDRYLGLCHRRLKDFKTIEFYNPLNVVFDVYVRDLALYVKSSKDYEYLENYLNQGNISTYLYYYLFVRLLLPSEYFNLLEEVLVDKKDNYQLIEIIKSVGEYEEFILNVCGIFKINLFYWIKKSN